MAASLITSIEIPSHCERIVECGLKIAAIFGIDVTYMSGCCFSVRTLWPWGVQSKVTLCLNDFVSGVLELVVAQWLWILPPQLEPKVYYYCLYLQHTGQDPILSHMNGPARPCPMFVRSSLMPYHFNIITWISEVRHWRHLMCSTWNMRHNLKRVYTCIEVSLCGVWRGVDFNKFFGPRNKTFLSSRAVSITISPFYSHILCGFTIDFCYVVLNWGTQSHCIFTPVTVWYLLPRLSGLASLAKTRLGRQVGQSFSCEEKTYDFGF